MTPKQKMISNFALNNDGLVTKKQAIELIGEGCFHSADFHVGNILSRMVNAGMLERVKPGVFRAKEIGEQKKLF